MLAKPLNKQAASIFEKIISQIPEGESSIKIDNSGGAFMPLSVERLLVFDIGSQYSFCHYYEQNRDLCQDPEMLFLRHNNGLIYPMMFQPAIPPIYEESFLL